MQFIRHSNALKIAEKILDLDKIVKLYPCSIA